MKKITYCLYLSTIMTACTPNLYFIDRHTVMEEEAAGDWVDLESNMLKDLKKPGTTMIEKDMDNSRKQKVFSSLNGELNGKVE